MAEETEHQTKSPSGLTGLLEQLPLDRLREEAQNLAQAGMQRAAGAASEKVQEATDRLTEYTENGGPGVKAAVSAGQALNEGKSPMRAALGAGMTGAKEAVSQALGGGSGGGGGGGKVKVTNLVESIDVGVPVHVAYNQWTQFQDFPSFMKKVETVDAESDKQEEQKLNWKAQIVWSHRSWEATVVEQVPDKHIVWKSTGQKGRVDGAVSFHEITPNLTRILLVLEYYPQGLFERTGNIWRAQGRRARAEFKHFRRHVMTRTLLNPDDVEGWRGEIHDGEVVKTHEQVLEEEQQEAEGTEEPVEEGEGEELVDEEEEEQAEPEEGEEPRAEQEEEPEDEVEPEPAGAEHEEEDEEMEPEPADEEEEPTEAEEEPEPEPAAASRRRR